MPEAEPKLLEIREVRNLVCKMTQEEVDELIKEAAEHETEAAAFEGSLTSLQETVKGVKADLAEHLSAMRSCVRQAKKGTIHRDVDCEIVYDFNSKLVAIFRTDTEEMISCRWMNVEETQMPLGMEPPPLEPWQKERVNEWLEEQQEDDDEA